MTFFKCFFFTFVYCTKCILKTDGSHGKRDEKYPPFTYEKWASLDMVQLITVIQNVIIIHNTTTMPLMYLSSTYYFQEIWTLDCLLKNKLGLHMNVSRLKCTTFLSKRKLEIKKEEKHNNDLFNLSVKQIVFWKKSKIKSSKMYL